MNLKELDAVRVLWAVVGNSGVNSSPSRGQMCMNLKELDAARRFCKF